MAINSVATKPDGDGGEYTLYWHHDGTAELWHRPAGQVRRCVVGRQVLYKVRAEMARLGVGEDGWTPA